jgi:hypothetical protein
MRLTACDCPVDYYRRDHRAWWMKLAGSARRLYRCYACDAIMLIPHEDVAERQRQDRASHRRAHREAVAL